MKQEEKQDGSSIRPPGAYVLLGGSVCGVIEKT